MNLLSYVNSKFHIFKILKACKKYYPLNGEQKTLYLYINNVCLNLHDSHFNYVLPSSKTIHQQQQQPPIINVLNDIVTISIENLGGDGNNNNNTSNKKNVIYVNDETFKFIYDDNFKFIKFTKEFIDMVLRETPQRMVHAHALDHDIMSNLLEHVTIVLMPLNNNTSFMHKIVEEYNTSFANGNGIRIYQMLRLMFCYTLFKRGGKLSKMFSGETKDTERLCYETIKRIFSRFVCPYNLYMFDVTSIENLCIFFNTKITINTTIFNVINTYMDKNFLHAPPPDITFYCPTHYDVQNIFYNRYNDIQMLNWCVSKYRNVLISGPNGIGKSTLLACYIEMFVENQVNTTILRYANFTLSTIQDILYALLYILLPQQQQQHQQQQLFTEDINKNINFVHTLFMSGCCQVIYIVIDDVDNIECSDNNNIGIFQNFINFLLYHNKCLHFMGTTTSKQLFVETTNLYIFKLNLVTKQTLMHIITPYIQNFTLAHLKMLYNCKFNIKRLCTFIKWLVVYYKETPHESLDIIVEQFKRKTTKSTIERTFIEMQKKLNTLNLYTGDQLLPRILLPNLKIYDSKLFYILYET